MTCGWTTWLPGIVFLLLITTDVSEETLARGLGSDDEVKLIKYLFDDKNYNPLIRPVKNINESIEVQFNLALSQLISVDEKNQIMKTNVWLQMYWYDYQLTWNPDKYGGIKTIRINHSKAWRPDIVLFNNADGKYQVSYESNVVMNYDGLTYWIPPAIYRSSCDIDVKYFPFDQQECEMKFGSWTFLKNQLYFTYYLNRRTLDFSDYLRSGTWDIIDSPAWIQEQKDPVSGDIRDMYIVKFVVRRKTLFYIVNLIVPCVLISFASVCTFALPSDGGEKITMCISILLALVVFLLLISKILPPALTIPLIAKYLLFNFIMTIIAIGCTVFVINKNYRTPRTHTMPRWIRVVFLNYLPKALFMTRPEHETRWQDRPLNDTNDKSSKSTPKGTLHRTPEIERKLLEIKKIHLAQADDHRLTEKNDTISSLDVFGEDFLRASEALKFIRQHTLKHDHYDTIIDDWKYVASVIDRLLLVIFLLVTVGGTLGIFLQAPNIFSVVDQDAIIDKLIADGKYEVTYESNVVLMQPDGAANIYQVPPAIYKSSCDINVEYFPFDEQECEMKFGSWTFEADQLNFTYYKFYGLDMTDYLKSGTWDIVDCPSRIVICTDPETKRRISMYIAKFIIRRKTLFYTVNLIIPCMLISFVSICVFMLPADAGEKITLIISILLALVVFLLLISKLLPPSKTIPLIAKYLLFTFIMNIIAIGSTVFIINRNYRTPRTHRMPEWVRIVFLKYLPKFLFMTRPNHDNRWKSPLRVYSEENLDDDMKRHVEMCNKHTRNCQLHNISETTEVGYAPLSAELMEATEAIGFITEHLKWEDRYDSVTDDWKYMASVVDRMLLYIFLLVTVCGTIGILVQAPYILENIDQDELLSKIMDKYKINKEGQVAPVTIYQNAPC